MGWDLRSQGVALGYHRLPRWSNARSCIAYLGVLRRGFEHWIVVRLVYACLFVVRWGVIQFVVRWGGVQGVVCIRLQRIGLYFCELGHCDWRNVVLAYVPTAQTPIAQGIALGMPAPDDPLPQRPERATCPVYFAPSGQRDLVCEYPGRRCALPWAKL